ncbi:acVLRF1 family peptidyl-tRNA hydrolase [Actinopolyspora mortivallis]|uniref:acVLRF1 family peptidyl-tRNA hydrolase n=1 Tax=Actinopolyspora mortivallis TaxID=33906 RepID=UPI00047AC301|nr:acVLRF1 family peptidyl-tRNA hydrolase [Actinopolyspora mortivallis]
MSRVRQLPGGGRAVEVEPERLLGWFERFAANHEGTESTTVEPRHVRVLTSDGASATVRVPFEELSPPHGTRPGLEVDGLVEHVGRSRRTGLVLARHGAHSVGVAQGEEVLFSSTDRHHLQGRSKAGGWSQKRYARRRQGQARRAVSAVADTVAEVLLPERERLEGLVLGGDRGVLSELGSDTRLAELWRWAEPRVLDVAEPRRSVLERAARRARAVEVEVREPGG